MKYIPGNIYLNSSVGSISEITAYICAGMVLNFFGGRAAFLVSYSFAAIGAFLILSVHEDSAVLMAVFVLIAKFGTSFAFAIVYLVTPRLFDTDITTTAFGICNVFANISTIAAPLLSEA